MKEHISYNQKITRAKNDLRTRLPPRLLKKKELWTYNKTRWQIIKVNSKIIWRKFDLATRGMGLYLLCLMGIFIMITIIPLVFQYVSEELNKTKYREALKTSCVDMDFYKWNFQACEDIEIRPQQTRGNQI